MMGFVIAVHVAACVLLILIILIQAGRGGGLVEGFSGVESVFGTKTNVFLTRATSIFSILFFLTCIMLALLSARQSRSLMRDTQAATATAVPTPAAPTTTAQPEELPKQETSRTP